MDSYRCSLAVFTLVITWLCFVPPALAESSTFTVCCSSQNDLFRTLKENDLKVQRWDTPEKAIAAAPRGSAVLLLADAYPTNTLQLSEEVFKTAAKKNLRVYVEFPSFVPGVKFSAPQKMHWERFVVNGNQFGAALPAMRIVMAHESYILPSTATNSLINAARVAGYNTAIYGMPTNAQPVLFSLPDQKVFVATTRLSSFITGRYAPSEDWATIWTYILRELSQRDLPLLKTRDRVQSMYGPSEKLPSKYERRAFREASDWVFNSRLLIHEDRVPELMTALKKNEPMTDAPTAKTQSGDGRFGILEGYNSAIRVDGSQPQLTPIRGDCQAETAMILGFDWAINKEKRSYQTASNLMDFLYFNSDLCTGDRGNRKHPAFGLISWGSTMPAWMVANYGDDNARVMLATMLTATTLKSDRWDESLLRALYANLRTTGPSGFRGDRIDMPQLETHGWKYFQDTDRVSYSPHFEAYSWACFLWAYQHTGEREFLDKTKIGIQKMMEAFPDKWRWNDNMERAHMLLTLAWLVRIEDTPEHRRWLKLVAGDLINIQQASGAIPERFRGSKGSHYSIPESNEAYGTAETPLLQENGDPVSDQLYVTGLALLAFREAVAATGDQRIKAAEDKLTEYLCRIQIRSKEIPYLHGTWFRAFDFERWEPWASSGDAGWGAWSVEAGWGQAWTAAVLGMRLENTSFWEMTSSTRIREKWNSVKKDMAKNQGGPWTGDDKP
ncbi:MAG: hypothetical protein ABI042_19785 [Verrucomicrobiota bacterium]